MQQAQAQTPRYGEVTVPANLYVLFDPAVQFQDEIMGIVERSYPQSTVRRIEGNPSFRQFLNNLLSQHLPVLNYGVVGVYQWGVSAKSRYFQNLEHELKLGDSSKPFYCLEPQTIPGYTQMVEEKQQAESLAAASEQETARKTIDAIKAVYNARTPLKKAVEELNNTLKRDGYPAAGKHSQKAAGVKRIRPSNWLFLTPDVQLPGMAAILNMICQPADMVAISITSQSDDAQEMLRHSPERFKAALVQGVENAAPELSAHIGGLIDAFIPAYQAADKLVTKLGRGPANTCYKQAARELELKKGGVGRGEA